MKLLLCFLALVPFVVAGQQFCNVNEVYKNCGYCDKICNEGPVACAAYCRPGCYCQDGYVRSFAGGICIPIGACPAPPNPEPNYCDINEVYMDCGGCDQLCNEGPIACADYCRPGCYCQEGYVRSFDRGICVPRNNCPAPPNPQPAPTYCDINEIYMDCGGCDQFCNEGPIACADYCRPGCYCQEGYVRSFDGGICIPRNNCPAPPNPQPAPTYCDINEVYIECGGCDQFCNEGPIACADYCRPGCYCQNGYVRSFNGGICIPRNSCPSSQDYNPPPMMENSGSANDYYGPPPMIENSGYSYDYYGPPPMIENSGYSYDYNGPPPMIENSGSSYDDYGPPPMIENSGSNYDDYGPPPMIENSGSNYDDYGPPPMIENSGPPQCGPHEVYQTCGVGWDCEDYCGRGANACAYCEDGCYCEPGYIRAGPEDDAACVPKDSCPRAYGGSSGGSNSGSSYDDYGPPPMIENSGPLAQNAGPDSAIQCGKNEVYDSCGVGKQCEDYCGRGPNACAYCQAGCYCKKNYVREGPGPDAKCIPEKKCPRALAGGSPPAKSSGPLNGPAQKCMKNEEYQTCGTACPASCQNKSPICADSCVEGCFCKKGYIRKYADNQTKLNKCIKADKCPKS